LNRNLYIYGVYMVYMVQAMIDINEKANQVLNIIKAKYNLKDKSEAINIMAKKYEENCLEPELRPEYVERLNKLEKEKGIPFRNMAELRKIIEG